MVGVVSRLNAGIRDIWLELGVGDVVVIEGASVAAKALGICTIVWLNRLETMQNPMGNNNNCRMCWRIAWILLASESSTERFTLRLGLEQVECRARWPNRFRLVITYIEIIFRDLDTRRGQGRAQELYVSLLKIENGTIFRSVQMTK